MTETPFSGSPLARLVLFFVCMALAGSFIAGMHYAAVDLPAQKNIQAPQNAASSRSNCEICMHNCKVDPEYYNCTSICKDLECSGEL